MQLLERLIAAKYVMPNGDLQGQFFFCIIICLLCYEIKQNLLVCKQNGVLDSW